MLPDGYHLDALGPEHAEPLAAAYRRNRQPLAAFEPARDASWFTTEGQTVAVAGQLSMTRRGLAAAWVLTHEEQVVGRVNLNNIVMGVLRSASVGYWVDHQHRGRGLASGAVRLTCDLATERGLHRIEAGTLLDNTASQRVLLGCGFEEFGLAPAFLFLDGAWRDHRLFQRILHDDPLRGAG